MPRSYPRVVAARLWWTGWIVGLVAGTSWGTPPQPLAAAQMPRYAHILVIVAENKGSELIIGPATVAPNLNRLAQQYGLASQFFDAVHPREGNYVSRMPG